MCLIGNYLHLLVGCILCLQGLDICFRRRLGWGWSKIKKKEERCLGWLIAALGICCRREKKLFQLFWPGITLHEWGYLNPFFTRNAVKKIMLWDIGPKGGRGTGKITNFINNQFGILLDRGGGPKVHVPKYNFFILMASVMLPSCYSQFMDIKKY